jgi:outer membrane immunogenic protein
MKSILTGVALAALIGACPAVAADLSRPPPPVVKAPVMAPIFSWTGFYIGGNIGAAWAQHNWNDSARGLNFNNGSNNAVFIGGGQVGGNYQFNNFVIGVEGTFDWAGDHNGNGTAILTPAGNLIQVTSNDTRISTVAARFGWAWADRALFYGKAGGGWVGNNGFTVTDLNTGLSVSTSGSNNVSGWLVGGGLEWAFINNWSIKVEYDYLGLGSRSFTVPVGSPFPRLVGDTFTTSNNNSVQMLTVGFNYRFNWGGYGTQY